MTKRITAPQAALSIWVLAVLLLSLATGSRAWASPVAENTRALCSDHLDNDLDGHEDCDDQDCQDLVICAPKPVAPRVVAPVVVAPTRSPDYVQRRSRATMRLVAGGILLGVSAVMIGGSAGLWIVRNGESYAADRLPYTVGGVILDVAGVGMLAAGATLVTLGAGDAAALRYAHSPTVSVSF